jgi:hypothetical protein
MFEHNAIDLGYKDLVCQTGPKRRLYHTPDGNSYPSITTVLSGMSKAGLDKWRARVGEKEAARVSAYASKRGTAVHELLERWIDNVEDYKQDANLIVWSNFLEVKDEITERLSLVYAQEVPLYSDHLGVAGRVDLVGVWDGKPAIIDFKTSGKIKKRHFCKGYFMQEAFYAVAWEERTGQPITQLVTIIAGDAGKQIFVEDRNDWTDSLENRIAEYKLENE